MSVIKLRYPGTCASCGESLSAGTRAHWDKEAKTANCLGCHPLADSGDGAPSDVMAGPGEGGLIREQNPIATGSAGASARREYERRVESERGQKEARIADDARWRDDVKSEHPMLGRVAAALTPKPKMTRESQSTRNWAIGAVGEDRLGRVLDSWPGVVALHDRRVPKSKANIDHVVVAAAGVFIIDAKRYTGQVHQREVGSLFRPDKRLFVGRRDCSKLVAGALWQAGETRKVLPPEAAPVPIYAALCFIDAEWSLFSRPFYIEGVFVGWPRALKKFVLQEGSLSPPVIEATARHLAEELRSA